MRVIVTGNVDFGAETFGVVRRVMKAFEAEFGQVSELLAADKCPASAKQAKVWAGLVGVQVSEFTPRLSRGLLDTVHARQACDQEMLEEADAVIYLGNDRGSFLLAQAKRRGVRVYQQDDAALGAA